MILHMRETFLSFLAGGDSILIRKPVAKNILSAQLFLSFYTFLQLLVDSSIALHSAAALATSRGQVEVEIVSM